VQKPTAMLARAAGLHEFSSNDPTPDFRCLMLPPIVDAGGDAEAGADAGTSAEAGASAEAGTNPEAGAEAGPSPSATLTGYVQIFSTSPINLGTIGVNVQVFPVDPSTGTLGLIPLGSYVTSTSDTSETNTWLQACAGECLFRHYEIPGVPIGTPLVIETSDGTGDGTWANLYEYNVYFSGPTCSADGGEPCVNYDVTAVTTTDIDALAQPLSLDPSTGVIVGEVHDCASSANVDGIRLAGANVDTDQPHIGAMLYFGNTEANPLPDPSRAAQNFGTNDLGRFAAFNFTAGIPIRVSAIGNIDCQDTLIGTNVVQAFPGSMTWITMRGRAAYQTATQPPVVVSP
jgi:hypothetical protein